MSPKNRKNKNLRNPRPESFSDQVFSLWLRESKRRGGNFQRSFPAMGHGMSAGDGWFPHLAVLERKHLFSESLRKKFRLNVLWT